MNCDGVLETPVAFTYNFSKSPEGRKRPTSGLTMSCTSEVMSEEDAAPMIKAIASPITPKVFRKSKNSWMSVFFAGGLSVTAVYAGQS